MDIVVKNTTVSVQLANCDWIRQSICSKHHDFVVNNETNNHLVKSKSITKI